MERWIVIPRWDEFQHRDASRSDALIWIKVYTRLLSDDNYLSLTPHQRAVLHGLWLEYARSRCQLRANTASLSSRLALRVSSRQLEALSDAGFIQLSASNPLANLLAQNRTEQTVTASRAVTVASYAAAQKKPPGKHLPADLLEQVTHLRGADAKTPNVVEAFFRRGLPEAAFRNALEATRLARGQMRGTEIGYFVGTLKQLESSGQYGT